MTAVTGSFHAQMFSAQFHLCENLMMANDAYPPDMLMRLALKTCTRAVEDRDKRCKTVICSQVEVKQPTVIPHQPIYSP